MSATAGDLPRTAATRRPDPGPNGQEDIQLSWTAWPSHRIPRAVAPARLGGAAPVDRGCDEETT